MSIQQASIKLYFYTYSYMHNMHLSWLHFSIRSTYLTYNEWTDTPIITTINTTAHPIKHIEFPSITICSQGLAKDVIHTVIQRQFEGYLKSKGIKANTTSKTNPSGTLKRRKRSTESLVIDKLSQVEVTEIKPDL